MNSIACYSTLPFLKKMAIDTHRQRLPLAIILPHVDSNAPAHESSNQDWPDMQRYLHSLGLPYDSCLQDFYREVGYEKIIALWKLLCPMVICYSHIIDTLRKSQIYEESLRKLDALDLDALLKEIPAINEQSRNMYENNETQFSAGELFPSASIDDLSTNMAKIDAALRKLCKGAAANIPEAARANARIAARVQDWLKKIWARPVHTSVA